VSKTRIIIPDSHGFYADEAAIKSCAKDIKRLDPDEVVMLGDHVDCSGFLSTHGMPGTTEECDYSYEEDIKAAKRHLRLFTDAAPRATFHYLEGNHEARVGRWAVAQAFAKRVDAEGIRKELCPEHLLDLKGLGINYYRTDRKYQGISIPGTIRLGKCYYTHGISAGKHAAERHLDQFAASVVFGHIHRNVAVITKKVSTGTIGAWSPGCLAILQQPYAKSTPTGHSHGYAVQFTEKSGTFQHIQVTIEDGVSMLGKLAGRIK
jgi:3',5'-cyclic AMP phosphodiesterase CpdA